MSGSEFVLQEEAVIAHLFWAMAAVEQVTVVISGRAISGMLLAPDPDEHAAVFAPAPGQTIPERALKKGKIVLVKYASLGEEYQFKSQILDPRPAKWLLSIPRDIRRTDRRLVERTDVHVSRRHTVQLLKSDGNKRILLIHDLSPAGLGIIFDPQLDQFEEGQVLRGVLNLPGRDDLTVRFEVIAIHGIESDMSQRLLGCRFLGLGFDGCERVALALDGAG
jgi:c-di-GMP-binding flagellar brake protein YcgR